MKRAHWATAFSFVSLLSLALSGCGRSFVAATPPGFVDFGEERYGSREYRAATADGVVLGIRTLENDPEGELSFWSKVLENRMRESGGYALLEKRSVKNRGGLEGTQFRFGHDEDGEPFLYWVTLFVDEKKLFLLEAGGPKAEMERQSAQIEWSVQNFLQK